MPPSEAQRQREAEPALPDDGIAVREWPVVGLEPPGRVARALAWTRGDSRLVEVGHPHARLRPAAVISVGDQNHDDDDGGGNRHPSAQPR